MSVIIPEIIMLIFFITYKTTNYERIEQGYCLYIYDNLCEFCIIDQAIDLLLLFMIENNLMLTYTFN